MGSTVSILSLLGMSGPSVGTERGQWRWQGPPVLVLLAVLCEALGKLLNLFKPPFFIFKMEIAIPVSPVPPVHQGPGHL